MKSPVFEWYGTQYSFEERGSDWYWALGIVAAAAVLTSILFGNILLGLVILAGAVTLGLNASRQNKTHRFAVYDDGIAIDDNLYLYDDIRDFSILEFLDPAQPPALSVKTNHILSSHFWVPINDHDPQVIYDYISQHLPEGMHEETIIDRLTAFLRL